MKVETVSRLMHIQKLISSIDRQFKVGIIYFLPQIRHSKILGSKMLPGMMTSPGATASNPGISRNLFPSGMRSPADRAITPERKFRGPTDSESVMSGSLRTENDLLRCQLNDLIAREKSQRVELQRLRQHRDAEVASLVQSSTSQMKNEVEQLKSMLQNTSGQLLQALSEREQAKAQKEKLARALEESRQTSASQEVGSRERLRAMEEALNVATGMATNLASKIEGFQRHVLPTFKPTGVENKQAKVTPDVSEGKSLVEQLTKVENALTMLRVIVDAKNDTLVLIRGKLKQENEELRSQLLQARESRQGQIKTMQATSKIEDQDNGAEKHMLRQEMQSLQNLFKEEVRQLKSKLKMYESEEQHGQGRLSVLQKELAALQEKLSSVEASKVFLENNLKDEASARSQLVSQLFALRKENEKTKAELETLKLSQKFLGRQTRTSTGAGSRIPAEKMDLMNTVNQLLVETNKLKTEKLALEEELKNQRRTQVRDRVKRTVTSRDVDMAALNKVGDTDLASRLARSRLQNLGIQDSPTPTRTTTPPSSDCGTPASGSMGSFDLDGATTDLLKGALQSAGLDVGRY
eukprot:Gb_39211 [translate_table: standard]